MTIQGSKLGDKLHYQEVRVLEGMSNGFSNKEIADRMYISGETVKTYAVSINRKLGTNNRSQAVVVAVRLGIIACPCGMSGVVSNQFLGE